MSQFLFRHVKTTNNNFVSSGVAKNRGNKGRIYCPRKFSHHTQPLETAVAKYEIAGEVTAEGNRVVVGARFKATQEGELVVFSYLKR